MDDEEITNFHEEGDESNSMKNNWKWESREEVGYDE